MLLKVVSWACYFVLLFINDIVESSRKLHYVLYADDTNIFYSGKNLIDLIFEANVELLKVASWFSANKLKINQTKTKFMIFNFGKQNDTLIENVNLTIDGNCIDQVQSAIYVGVAMDNKLTWEKHIELISKKIRSQVGVMSELRRFLPSSTMLSLYYTLIYPYLTYCNFVWARTFNKLIKPLIILQKQAVCLYCCASFRAHTSSLFKSLNLLKLPDILSQWTSLFMYKLKNDLLPVMFYDSFNLNSDVYFFNTTKKNDFHVPKFTNLFLQNKSIRYQGPHKWNYMLSHLKGVKNHNAFKLKLKRTILATY